MRICDCLSNLRELGALTYCLVVDLERRPDAGEALSTMSPWHVQENKWRAACYGLDAVVILDADGNERLLIEDLAGVLTRLEPVAKALHCVEKLAAVSDMSCYGASY